MTSQGRCSDGKNRLPQLFLPWDTATVNLLAHAKPVPPIGRRKTVIWIGSLTARVMIRQGSLGGMLTLNDRMFDPANDHGEQLAVFSTPLNAEVLSPQVWHDVSLKWNLAKSECQVFVDGAKVDQLSIKNSTLNGVSYIRFRSTARDPDTAGFLVDSVKVSIDDPCAPAIRPEDQIEHEKRYIDHVVPTGRSDL